MIKTGETITIEAIPLTSENLADIRTLPLTSLTCITRNRFSLYGAQVPATTSIRLLNYLQSQDISFGRFPLSYLL